MNQNPIISIEPETPDVSIEIKVSNEGKPGYTPQRGIDYWTDADKKEIVDDVKQEIGDLPGGGDAGNAVQWSDNLQYAGASDKATLGYAGYDSDALAYTARNGKTIVLPRSIGIGGSERMPDADGVIRMPDEYNPVAATKDHRGGVVIGDGIEVEDGGRISVPLASNDGPAGLVCPGKGLEVKSGDLKVKYDEFVATREEQSLGEEAQARARENIGAASAEDVARLTEEKADKKDIPAPYTLPTASADVKGGVKINPKDFVMDGDVLGVVPEPVYKLIETIAIEAEDISKIARTQTPDGQDYAFSNIELKITSPAGLAEAIPVAFAVKFSSGFQLYDYQPQAIRKSLATVCRCFFSINSDGSAEIEDIVGSTVAEAVGTQNYRKYKQAGVAADAYITSLHIASVGIMPRGSIIEIKGVRANA